MAHDSGAALAAGRDATEALLLALCVVDHTPQARTQIARLAAGPVDWERLASLAALHGVVGLVRRTLGALDLSALPPPAPRQAMEAAATQIAFDGMLHLRETTRMAAALAGAAIQPLVLKGQALGDLLYGDPLLRPSTDIDLLVRSDEIDAAQQALASVGYAPQSDAWLAFQRAHSYHISLWREALPGQPVLLELHWDLGPRQLFTYDLPSWRRRAQPFQLAGSAAALQRFSPDEQVLHLALHMRKHRYVGLRWLVDVAHLLRRFEAALDWPYLVESAGQAGLRTLLYTSVVLASQLLAAPAPQRWLQQLAPAPARRRLLRSVLTQDALMTPVEMEDAGWTRLAPAEVLLLDRPAAMARELRYRLFPPLEKLDGPEAAASGAGRPVSRYVQRLARRTQTLLGRRSR